MIFAQRSAFVRVVAASGRSFLLDGCPLGAAVLAQQVARCDAGCYRTRCALAASKPMVKCVSIGYTRGMKDTGLRIRIERQLRDRFLATCREQDRPAAQVLREFMRGYVAANDSRKVQDNKKGGE